MNIKSWMRNGLAKLLSVSGVTSPHRRGNDRLSIATFHRVLPQEQRRSYPFAGLAVTPQELDAFLGYLTQHFDCGTLAGQHERYLRGDKTSRPLLAITFDDAQYDNFRNARPLLDRYGIRASFFVPVAAVERQELLWHDRLGFAVHALLQNDEGKLRLSKMLADAGLPVADLAITAGKITQAAKGLALLSRLRLVEEVALAASVAVPEYARMMTFDELTRLAGDGHEIGSHSMTHCMMPECDDHALDYEVAESRRKLQSRTGQQIDSFCYPNGNCDARTAQAVAQAGYRRGISTAWGSNDRYADRYRLRRFDMVAKHVQSSSGQFNPALLAFRMSGLYPGLGVK